VLQPSVYSLFVTASVLACELLGARLAWRALRNVCTVQPALLLVAGAVQAMSSAHPLADLGVIAWPVGVAALYWILRRQERDDAAALAAALRLPGQPAGQHLGIRVEPALALPRRILGLDDVARQVLANGVPGQPGSAPDLANRQSVTMMPAPNDTQ